MVVKRREYSNYFRLDQTSFQTGVDKSLKQFDLTFRSQESMALTLLTQSMDPFGECINPGAHK